jgi:hypothetical protein
MIPVVLIAGLSRFLACGESVLIGAGRASSGGRRDPTAIPATRVGAGSIAEHYMFRKMTKLSYFITAGRRSNFFKSIHIASEHLSGITV